MAMTFLPEAASEAAPHVDALFLTLLGICGLVALGVFVMLAYYAVKYRRGSRADRRHRVSRNLPLELSWLAIPFVIFMGLFGWGAKLFFEMARPNAGATEIFVVGKQWMWKFQHPAGRREINTLHVPVGKPVRLIMISQDVIHDVFVPAFRLHHDVLPGRYTRMEFTVSRPGTYPLLCSQYCGTAHASMTGEVIAVSPSEFEAWLSEVPPEGSMAQAGERLFRSLGCSGCHMGSTTVHAPPLEGLYGKPVPLQGGGFAFADDQYLHDSILLPGKQIVAGYAPIMPSYQGQIDEEQVLQLVAYLRSLSERSAP
ncbi:Cytochrome c oxidase subunit 2 precursor [compost metagenome]